MITGNKNNKYPDGCIESSKLTIDLPLYLGGIKLVNFPLIFFETYDPEPLTVIFASTTSEW